MKRGNFHWCVISDDFFFENKLLCYFHLLSLSLYLDRRLNLRILFCFVLCVCVWLRRVCFAISIQPFKMILLWSVAQETFFLIFFFFYCLFFTLFLVFFHLIFCWLDLRIVKTSNLRSMNNHLKINVINTYIIYICYCVLCAPRVLYLFLLLFDDHFLNANCSFCSFFFIFIYRFVFFFVVWGNEILFSLNPATSLTLYIL